MVRSGSTSSGRRGLLRAALLAPFGGLAAGSAADDYASAAEVFAAIDRHQAEVEARLHAIVAAQPAAQAFAASLGRDYARHRARRAALRRRLNIPAAAAAPAAEGAEASLQGLREALQALVYAHAEGLPALDDPRAVDVLAHDMVDLARQLAVLGLWIDQEQARG